MHKSFVIEKYKTNNYNYLNKNTKKFQKIWLLIQTELPEKIIKKCSSMICYSYRIMNSNKAY